MLACLSPCLLVCLHACLLHAHLHACLHASMLACMFACMHACLLSYLLSFFCLLSGVGKVLRVDWNIASISGIYIWIISDSSEHSEWKTCLGNLNVS